MLYKLKKILIHGTVVQVRDMAQGPLVFFEIISTWQEHNVYFVIKGLNIFQKNTIMNYKS